MQKLAAAILYLQDECPYKCSYCVINSPGYTVQRGSRASTQEGRHAIERFFEARPGCHVFLTGGEIMLLPGFVELCAGLANSGFISLDTANSIGREVFERFCSEVPAGRVDLVRCALHEHDESEQRLLAYIERALQMQRAGFPVIVTYVASPERLSRIPHYYELFRSNGLPFVVVPLLTREYPGAYTESQVALIDRYSVSAVYRSKMGKFRKSMGKSCNAGVSRVNVNCITGEIAACWRCRKSIGNIYEDRLELASTERVCTADWCSVEYEPQQSLEGLFLADLRHVLSLQRRYDPSIYAEILARSV